MLSYCLNCRKNTESKNLHVVNSKNRRRMLLSKSEVCDSKNSKFIKEQEASELLSSLGIKTPLSKITLIGPLLCFCFFLSGFSFTTVHESQDCRGRGRAFL